MQYEISTDKLKNLWYQLIAVLFHFAFYFPSCLEINGFRFFITHEFKDCIKVYFIWSSFRLDYRLNVVVFYRDALVREVTVNSPEGCQLGPSREGQAFASPGAPELVELPHADRASLERGVILWMAPDGLYARRRCPCRVYWEGAHAPPTDKPNKLEREQNCKLLDTHLFITG